MDPKPTLLLAGEEDLLYVGLLRFLPEAAFPRLPLPDVWLQISPALQHRGAAHVCQLRPAGVSARGKSSGTTFCIVSYCLTVHFLTPACTKRLTKFRVLAVFV